MELKLKYYNDYEIRDVDHSKVIWAGANGFCFDESGKVAIVLEHEKGFWNLPGGGREGTETPIETFVREVVEETQCQPTYIKYFHCVYAKCFDASGAEVPVKENAISFRYVCRLKSIQEFVPRKDGQEMDERKFVTLEELPEYITWLKDSENGRESLERLKMLNIRKDNLC